MATTPNYSWPTPNDTDLASLGASAIRSLGNAIDTTVKANSLIGLMPSIGYVSGTYYSPIFNGRSSSFTPTNNQVHYLPFLVTKDGISFDRIGIESGGTFTTSGNVNVGIYNNSNGKPSTLVTSSNVTVAASITKYEATIATTLNNGWYWLAVQKTTGTFTLNGQTRGTAPVWYDQSNSTNAFGSSGNFIGWQETTGTAALPATAGAVTQITLASGHFAWLRKA